MYFSYFAHFKILSLPSLRTQQKLLMGTYYHLLYKGLTLVNTKRKNYVFDLTVWRDVDNKLNLVKRTHYTASIPKIDTEGKKFKVKKKKKA